MSNFGGWSVDKELFDFIIKSFKHGSTMLEFGSGNATQEFCKYFKVYSIEHNPKWILDNGSHYIYAPLKNGWYDLETVKIPKYDFVLVDAPPNKNRKNFIHHFDKFNTDVPFIFDDVNRKGDYELANAFFKYVSKYRDAEMKLHKHNKSFAVVW